jgi:uncharacterized protein
MIADVILGVACVAGQVMAAQPPPQAVIVDPPANKDFPPGVVGLTVPSHGVEMDAVLYLAAGSGPHGTVLLLHGLPGYEQNADLAQSIRRAGWNVLIFHYRGLWGTGGSFSASTAIEDTAEAVRFLRDPAIAAKYRANPQRIVVIGHSFGGFLAGYEGAHDSTLAGVGMIAAVDLGKINADPKERETRLKRWELQMHPVHGATAPELFAEAERHTKDWDYVQWADLLSARPVLLVEADDQNRSDMTALASSLRAKNAAGLVEKSLSTDHSVSDHRIALQAIVIGWLERLQGDHR